MINIVCLKFGTKYNADYVNKLYRATKRNTTLPFTFHCFTEDPSGIDNDVVIHHLKDTIPLEKINDNSPYGLGWWYKMYLFKGDSEIGGRIFYMDLDTLVTGNIDEILQLTEPFIVLRDFFLAQRPNNRDRFGSGREAVGSGIMMWNAGQLTNLWNTFIQDPIKAITSLKPHGDQKLIQILTKHENRTYFQDVVQNQIVSYKVHCHKGTLAPNARIVCYHGKPSIPESITNITRVQGYNIPPAKWVGDHWK